MSFLSSWMWDISERIAFFSCSSKYTEFSFDFVYFRL